MKTIFNYLTLSTSLVIFGCSLNTNTNTKTPVAISEGPNDSPNFDINYFKPLPKDNANEPNWHLIEQIQTKDNYAYWECVWKDFDNGRGKIVVYKGSPSYSTAAKKINCSWGFFVECMPLACFSYIVGVRPDNQLDSINTNEKLKKFIGHIDNLEEVILLAKLNGFWYDTDTIIGGAYRERDNDYLLYLLEYSSTPVTYKSVKAILTKDGDFRVIDKKKYKETDEYIME